MRGRVAPFVMPTMILATKQTIKVPHITFPQEK
jgi:hypothetical protein